MTFPFLKECIPYCHFHGYTELQNSFRFLIPDSKIIASMLILKIFYTTSNMLIVFSCYDSNFFSLELANKTDKTIMESLSLFSF